MRARVAGGGGGGRPRRGGGPPCGRCTTGTTPRRCPTRAGRRASAAPRGRCSRPPGCSTGSGGRRGRTRRGATAAPGCGTAPARSGRAGSPTGTGTTARSEWSSAPLRATISAFSFSTSTTARRIGHDAQRLEAGVEQQCSSHGVLSASVWFTAGVHGVGSLPTPPGLPAAHSPGAPLDCGAGASPRHHSR